MDEEIKALLETAEQAIEAGISPDQVFNPRGPYGYLTILSKEECLQEIDKMFRNRPKQGED